jgi:hypothetical protein
MVRTPMDTEVPYFTLRIVDKGRFKFFLYILAFKGTKLL